MLCVYLVLGCVCLFRLYVLVVAGPCLCVLVLALIVKAVLIVYSSGLYKLSRTIAEFRCIDLLHIFYCTVLRSGQVHITAVVPYSGFLL